MRLGLALKAFFRVLRDRTFAEQLDQLLQGQTLALSTTEVSLADRLRADMVAQAPTRSEALTLLAALQREARLIDFLMEDLSGYDDAHIGAAVRDVHRACAAALERMFALRPLRYQEEGAHVEVVAGYDPMQVTLTGNVTGQLPLRGHLSASRLASHAVRAAGMERPGGIGACHCPC